jgi:hypothetical protein
MLADLANHLWNFALDSFRCSKEQVCQIGGEVRHIDLRGMPMEGYRLGFCVHFGDL